MAVFAVFFFFPSRRRHTRLDCDWSSDVCSSDLPLPLGYEKHNETRGLYPVFAEHFANFPGEVPPLDLSKGEGSGVEHVRPRIDSVASKDKEIDIDGVAGAARRVRPTGFSKVGCGAVPVDGNRSHQCGHLLGE